MECGFCSSVPLLDSVIRLLLQSVNNIRQYNSCFLYKTLYQSNSEMEQKCALSSNWYPKGVLLKWNASKTSTTSKTSASALLWIKYSMKMWLLLRGSTQVHRGWDLDDCSDVGMEWCTDADNTPIAAILSIGAEIDFSLNIQSNDGLLKTLCTSIGFRSLVFQSCPRICIWANTANAIAIDITFFNYEIQIKFRLISRLKHTIC